MRLRLIQIQICVDDHDVNDDNDDDDDDDDEGGNNPNTAGVLVAVFSRELNDELACHLSSPPPLLRISHRCRR